jgi:hypothetical protein
LALMGQFDKEQSRELQKHITVVVTR